MSFTNIYIDNSTEYSLFSLLSILFDKKMIFLDQFDNDNIVWLELNVELRLTLNSPRLSLFQVIYKKIPLSQNESWLFLEV